jgi:hypothetical protein
VNIDKLIKSYSSTPNQIPVRQELEAFLDPTTHSDVFLLLLYVSLTMYKYRFIPASF